jgi:hypothetical protein
MRPESILAGDNPSARGAWAGRVEGGGKGQGRNVEGHGDPDVAGRHPSSNEGKEHETESGDGREERDSADGMAMRRRRWVVEDDEGGDDGGGDEGGGGGGGCCKWMVTNTNVPKTMAMMTKGG